MNTGSIDAKTPQSYSDGWGVFMRVNEPLFTAFNRRHGRAYTARKQAMSSVALRLA